MTEEQNKSKRKKPSEFLNKKKKLVAELVDLLKKYNTIMTISIQGISSAQFQKTKKEINKIAKLKVYKKNLVEMALQESEKKDIKKIVDGVEENYALLFSDKDAFEVAAILSKNKIPSRAKAGQIAPQDIILEAGSTDLPAGPALSEITKLGVKASVDAGKITIKETKILVKKGEKVSETTATVLATLEMSPFLLSLKPLKAYDSKTGMLYTNIEVDSDKTIQELKEFSLKALWLALTTEYICKETIKGLLLKAHIQQEMLSKNLKN